MEPKKNNKTKPKTKEESRTKKKSMSSGLQFLIFIIVLILLMIGLLYGLPKYKEYKQEQIDDKTKFNGFDFYYDENQGYWITQVQIGRTPYNIPFYHHPTDLKGIKIQYGIEDIILLQRPKNIIISVPPDSNSQIALAAIEISKITGDRFQMLKIPTKSAVSSKAEGLPVANCNNASQETVVIQFIKSNKNLISSQGRCIKLEFKNNESIQVADAFAYSLVKII
jgi:hypothetical protein